MLSGFSAAHIPGGGQIVGKYSKQCAQKKAGPEAEERQGLTSTGRGLRISVAGMGWRGHSGRDTAREEERWEGELRQES